jgi:hypothetical protein
MTNPADQAAPQPTVAYEFAAADEHFTVELPCCRDDAVRHLVHLRGDQIAFTDAYDAFVREASDDAAPLFVTAEQRDLTTVRDVLDALGGARVQQIETTPA